MYQITAQSDTFSDSYTKNVDYLSLSAPRTFSALNIL